LLRLCDALRKAHRITNFVRTTWWTFVFFKSPNSTPWSASREGLANFPLIGVVPIGGKTTGEAVELLKSRYRNGYLINPQISLTVRSYAKKLFTVLGQVQKPGAYDIIGTSQITLLQAIGMAGGYTKIADPSNVTIKRLEDGREQVLKINAKKMAARRGACGLSCQTGRCHLRGGIAFLNYAGTPSAHIRTSFD
jgi:protein involved in polysaccharide export with SLBB domain